MSHSGSKPRRQISTMQGYKIWSHGMPYVSITELNMLKNSSTFTVSVPINFCIKLGFVSVNSPGNLTMWTYYVFYVWYG